MCALKLLLCLLLALIKLLLLRLLLLLVFGCLYKLGLIIVNLFVDKGAVFNWNILLGEFGQRTRYFDGQKVIKLFFALLNQLVGSPLLDT